MADYAMSFERLGERMSERARSPTLRHPQATSLSMLDGAVTAVVVGPVSMAPEEWVCPLLGVVPDAFNHDTEAFSAIAATLILHNAISEALSTRPESFEPLFARSSDGEVDTHPWCMGFYAVMKLRLSTGRGSSSRTGANTLCCRRSCSTASMTPAGPRCPWPCAARERRPASETTGATFPQPSRPCASSGRRYALSAARRRPHQAPWASRTAYVPVVLGSATGGLQI